MDHQQLRITADQRHHRLTAEVDISLVDDHHRISVSAQQALDFGNRNKTPGRSVGIRKHDAAIGFQIIIDCDFKGSVQRYLLVRNVVEAAVHRIKTVGDVRKQYRRFVFQQAEEHMRQHFVGTVADKHMIRGQAVAFGNCSAQAVAGGIRIQAQRVADFSAQSLQHASTRAIRAFIGIELDQIGEFRLLARHIGRQPLHHLAPVTAHVGLGTKAHRSRTGVRGQPLAFREFNRNPAEFHRTGLRYPDHTRAFLEIVNAER